MSLSFKKRKFWWLAAGVISVGIISLFVFKTADESEWFWIPFLTPAPAEVELPVAPAKKERGAISLMFGGDVMLSRTVNAKMVAYNNYLWPFEKIASTSAAADITVINLESPFLKNADYRVPTGSFSFKADPKALAGLKLAGVDVVALANNHMLNAGRKGLSDTLALLKESGILTAGAGLNETEARQAVIVDKNGWKIAFLSYAYPQDNSVATVDRPGIATLDKENLKTDIDAVRAEVDLVIVLMHAGTEYVSHPGEQQKMFARTAIEAGADAVIGHHPHWPQSWEIYQGKPVIYSLGNFVFDQMWSPETSRGLLARLVFQPDHSGQAELIPIEIKDYGQAQLWPDDKDINIFWKSFKLEAPVDLGWSAPAGN